MDVGGVIELYVSRRIMTHMDMGQMIEYGELPERVSRFQMRSSAARPKPT